MNLKIWADDNEKSFAKIDEGDLEWVTKLAERATAFRASMEGYQSNWYKCGRGKAELRAENEMLRDQLNHIKKLVDSNRAGHQVKFDLQLMFKEDAE